MQLALDEINRAGGILGGRALGMVVHDDDGKGENAARIAGAFVANPDVMAVIGHMTSDAQLAAARVYDGKLVAVSTGATSPLLTGISRWVYRMVPSDVATGASLAKLAERKGWRRAVILYENDPYGRELLGAFRTGYHGTVVRADAIEDGSEDLDPFVRLYAREAPDMILLVCPGRSATAFLRLASEHDLRAAIVGAETWSDEAKRYTGSEPIFVHTPVDLTPHDPAMARFVAQFQSRLHRMPSHNAVLAYDATKLFATALRETGPSRAGLQTYLRELGREHRFVGTTGPLRFDGNGDVVGAEGVTLRATHPGLEVER